MSDYVKKSESQKPVGTQSGERFDPKSLRRRRLRRKAIPEAQGTVDLWPGRPPVRHRRESGLEESIELRATDLLSVDGKEWDMPSVADIDALPRQAVAFRHRVFRVLAEGQLELGDPLEQSHYELLSVLGKGGMGLVCLARHRALGRNVALKLVRDSASVEKIEAFVREARITGMLEHPNVVPVYDLAMDDQGQIFYTMKRLSGASWEDLLSPGRIIDADVRADLEARHASMTPDDHLEILEKVCEALAYAHSKGWVHRDIKPANVMIGEFGEVLVGDWGLAMEFGQNNPYVRDPSLEAKLAGTPAYMAPEMARGELALVGPATDVYLLGGILYRLLVGEPPHSVDGTVEAAVKKAASGDVAAPCDVCPSLDPALSDIAVRALSTRMEDRYRDAQEFKQAIRRYRSHAKSLKVSRSALKALGELVSLLGGRRNEDDEGPARGFEALERPLPVLEENIGRSGRPFDDAHAVRAYALIGECIGSFRRALDLWAGNASALAGLERVQRLAFLFAMRQRDFAAARYYLEKVESFVSGGDETSQAGPGASVTATESSLGNWARQMRRIFESRMAHERERAAMARRLKMVAWGSAGVALFAMVVAAALLFRQRRLEKKKRALVEENLNLSRRQLVDADRRLALADRFRRAQMASAVVLRARLLGDDLGNLEESVVRYARRADYLISASPERLGRRPRNLAGRAGFFMDSDYRSSRTRPRNMVRRMPYGRPVSMEFVTVHLSPYARSSRERRKKAMEDVARISRLDRIFAQEHRLRGEILWSVAGTESGAFVSFPGFGRFADRRDYDPRKRPWYRAAMDSMDVTWSPPHIDAGGFGVLLSCVAPFRKQGRVAGVVGVEISMARLQRMLLETESADGQRGLIVTQSREILVDSSYETGLHTWRRPFELRRISDLEPALATYVEDALARRVSRNMADLVMIGENGLFAAYAPIEPTGWTLVILQKAKVSSSL